MNLCLSIASAALAVGFSNPEMSEDAAANLSSGGEYLSMYDDSGNVPDLSSATLTRRSLRDVTDTDQAYLDYWLKSVKENVTEEQWLPHYIDTQGYISLCLRLDFTEQRVVTGQEISDALAFFTTSARDLQAGLIGETHFSWTRPVKVGLFGIAHTSNVTFEGLTPEQNATIKFQNAEARCPASCSRFLNKKTVKDLKIEGRSHDFASCKEKRSNPDFPVNQYDLNLWFSDYSFGESSTSVAAGGAWGVRLLWANRNSASLYYHLVGRAAGLPNGENWPVWLEWWAIRPWTIMASTYHYPLTTSSEFYDFDIMMLRRLWQMSPVK